MQIFITKNNYKDLPRQIQRYKGNKKTIIKWEEPLPKFKDVIFNLEEISDRLIFRDIAFEIYNVPLCLMLGYKRYIRFDNSKFKKIDACLRCNYTSECKGIFLKYYTLYGADEIKPIGIETYLTDLEKCMIKVLQTENNISSERILKIAKRFRICAGCSDGVHVLLTGEKLIKKKIAKRGYKNGKYFWSLINEK
jgi:hypothetical protein